MRMECDWESWKVLWAKKTAIPQRAMPPSFCKALIFRTNCRNERWANCRADKKSGGCWRRRFSAGPGSSQVKSRRKEVERLQVTELAKSNIQRPYLKFEQKRPSGKHILEVEGVTKSYGDTPVIRSFTASVSRGEKIALMGRNGAGKTTLVNALLANSPTVPDAELPKTTAADGPFFHDGK